MDNYFLILFIIGLLLLGVTLASGWISRLPLSYALIYLLVGIFLGSYGIKVIGLRPDTYFLMRATELVVIISVYGCGLKINRPLRSREWRTTFALILILMPFSICAIAGFSHFGLGIGWGGAILLGAVLAPTDPVLASEVQLADLQDKDELRFGLTSEGGLNDALAFPFVYFGLYAIKDNNWLNWLPKWFAIDLVWAIGAGILMGIIVAKAVVWLEKRSQRKKPIEEVLENFIALGTILVVYSSTEMVNGYGFLAVFVAGLVVQRDYYHQQDKRLQQVEFIEEIEKLLEVGTILLLGSLLLVEPIFKYLPQSLMVAAALFFFIRPVGVWLSTYNYALPMRTKSLLAWFGIRGVGSIYYLTYAMGKGLKDSLGEQIAWICLSVIVMSILGHGISATPLMKWYEKDKKK